MVAPIVDPSFANLLLAEYEKSRAREMNDYVDLIDTAEYQHYLATFGNDALTHFADEFADEERELQLEYDLAVINAARREFPSNAESALRALDAYVSQRLTFRYVALSGAVAELEARTRELREENLRLASESALKKPLVFN
jgi:hypothetical protein